MESIGLRKSENLPPWPFRCHSERNEVRILDSDGVHRTPEIGESHSAPLEPCACPCPLSF